MPPPPGLCFPPVAVRELCSHSQSPTHSNHLMSTTFFLTLVSELHCLRSASEGVFHVVCGCNFLIWYRLLFSLIYYRCGCGVSILQSRVPTYSRYHFLAVFYWYVCIQIVWLILHGFLRLVGVDECALGTDDCSQYATCTDTDSSYYCTCSPGFTGDGRTCSGKSGMLQCHVLVARLIPIVKSIMLLSYLKVLVYMQCV